MGAGELQCCEASSMGRQRAHYHHLSQTELGPKAKHWWKWKAVILICPVFGVWVCVTVSMLYVPLLLPCLSLSVTLKHTFFLMCWVHRDLNLNWTLKVLRYNMIAGIIKIKIGLMYKVFHLGFLTRLFPFTFYFYFAVTLIYSSKQNCFQYTSEVREEILTMWPHCELVVNTFLNVTDSMKCLFCRNVGHSVQYNCSVKKQADYLIFASFPFLLLGIQPPLSVYFMDPKIGACRPVYNCYFINYNFVFICTTGQLS